MSKSYNNTLMLSEPEADVRAKLKTMVTDPARIRRTDPGNPDICPVFDLHKVFSTEETQAEGSPGLHHRRYRLHPVQRLGRRRHRQRNHPDSGAPPRPRSRPGQRRRHPWDGSARARRRAIQTLQHVRQAMGLE